MSASMRDGGGAQALTSDHYHGCGVLAGLDQRRRRGLLRSAVLGDLLGAGSTVLRHGDLRRRLDGRRRQRRRVGLGGVPVDERRRDGRAGRFSGRKIFRASPLAFRPMARRSWVTVIARRASRPSAGRAGADGRVWAICRAGASELSQGAYPPMARRSWVPAKARRVLEAAFRWTSGGGMVGLGELPGGRVENYAVSVSARWLDDRGRVRGHRRASRPSAGRAAAGWSGWALL